ncbi:Hypothetical predicted protein [Paramuricea clavata]|uniref:Uncharacterized protein n=1 Tax=Paramuricea clavata TaxID=317549 RepID=A0A6S7GTW8_PARCT|nr:Hypothetical predicted protein [Paramuricea clavata]
MECIGVLPAPEDVIQPANIPLFGILAENTTEPEQCYFCFEQIDGNELLAMTMQCCQQKAHCRCFQVWAAHYNGTDIKTVWCGYCRTPFPDKGTLLPVPTEQKQRTRTEQNPMLSNNDP